MLFSRHWIRVFVALALAYCPSAAPGQTPISPAEFSAQLPVTTRLTSLPTDRAIRNDAGLPLEQAGGTSDFSQDRPPKPAGPPRDFMSLLMPRVDASAEWESEVEGLSIGSYDLSIRMPLYPIFGPPPPMINTGYSFTQIDAPVMLDLPQRLHEFSLGAAWMRRINEKWMARFMLNGVFASDLENTGSDAWQIRGGGFALYRPSEHWSFAFGALATGRDDVPVLPAAGVIWQPSPELEVNLMMPKPRVSFLLIDHPKRQHWGYIGGGISGGTWAYDRTGGIPERLNYREWRVVLGWESKPPQAPGTFGTKGTRFNAEVGYVFGRRFEFDRAIPSISPDDAFLIRSGISF